VTSTAGLRGMPIEEMTLGADVGDLWVNGRREPSKLVRRVQTKARHQVRV
jgi:hypothetical protein